MVDEEAVVKINRRVSRKFPEMDGKRPSVKRQSGPNGLTQYLLTYRGQSALPGGRHINRIVRVVADNRGKILKMSTSK